ncbi:response regulator [Tundrisphaera lichenicola]|uniref:response regulator n=1 Tax=Tundrisphaera lichenicola TaxID=2029860 RepID=UPI003EC11C06
MIVEEDPPSMVSQAVLPRRRVLLVDDHEAGRKALSRLLTVAGFDVVDVNDATSAFAALRDDVGFDFVVTDLRLPDFDGRDVVLAARNLVPPPRISLMTGWDIDPDESDRMGVEWVFLKPINVHEMVDKLRKCSSKPDSSRTSSAT